MSAGEATPPSRAPELTEGAWAQAIALAFRFIFGLVLLATAAWLGSNIRQVQPDSRAVVLRLGQVARVREAGLLLAWPRPFEQVILLPAAERQIQFSLGPPSPPSETTASGQWSVAEDPRENAAFFLTADGVVHLDATLFYRIVDPGDYMLQAAHVPAALIRLTMASLVSLSAARDTDTLVVSHAGDDLTDADRSRRERLRTDLVAAINRRLADLRARGAGSGIEISRIDLGAALPGDAKTAFDGVLVATQLADQAVADARSSAARTAQRGEQDRNTLITNANAAAAERRNTASTRIAAIASLARAADGVSGAALLDLIYHDRMKLLLRRAGAVDAFDADTGARLLLPGRAP